MIIFDTDKLTHFSFGRQSVKANIAKHPNEIFAVTIITWNEALRGRSDAILKAADAAQLKLSMVNFAKTRQVLDVFDVIDVEDVAAQHFDRIREQKKLKMRRPDMLIACIALATNSLLVTGNTKDYQAVAGLKLADWSK